MDVTERGQAFTLEAFVAALVLLSCVAFALHVTGVTPTSASTANEGDGSQHEGIAAGVLESAAANDSLRPALLYWNGTDGAFHNASESYYVSRSPPEELAFGRQLEWAYGDRPVRYNVDVYYYNATDGDVERQTLVDHGTPSDDAVRAVETVTLFDDDPLYRADGTPGNVTVSDPESGFYAPDASPDGPVYNVLRVEVVVWRA